MKKILTGVLFSVGCAMVAAAADPWVTEGFEAFRRGTFGNAGQNLYVSRAGVLQRIHQFDLDRNGWVDLVFANCQDHHESAPSYVYDAETGRRLSTLESQGARSGVVADLDGDGVRDVVVTGFFDMVTPFSPAEIYYGQEDGSYSDRCHVRVQAPHAVGTAVGRFDGGKPALAFAMPEHGILRVCTQSEIGFEWNSFADIPCTADVIAAADFDGDGFDDLACRDSRETSTTVYWGGKDGLDAARKSEFPGVPASDCLSAEEAKGVQSDLEKKFVAPRLVEVVRFNGKTCFTLSTGKKVILFAVTKGRQAVRELELPFLMGLSVATGDFNRDGLDDVAVASQAADPADRMKQTSWIWLNAANGFVEKNRLTVGTRSACTVRALENRILFGQCAAGLRYTNDALLFTFEEGALNPVPRRFEGEDTRRAELFRGADGKLRVFLVNHYSRGSMGYDKTYVYWGREGGAYDGKDMTAVPCWCAVSAHAADFDDDGWAELLVDNNSENSLDMDPGHHLHHFGPRGFEPERSVCLKTDIGWGSMVADFDRDGWLDVITVGDHWNSFLFFAGGPDGLKRVKDYVVIPEPGDGVRKSGKMNSQGILDASRPLKREKAGPLRWPIAVDVNGDGWLDIVSPGGVRSCIYFGGPDGFDLARRQEMAGYKSCGVRAADLDGDGRPEVIFGGHCSQPNGNAIYRQPHHSYLHLYWNGPKGFSEARKCLLRADAASHLCVGDFDGNGFLDLFSCSYQGEIDRDINSFIYWNRGGNFRQFDRQDLITHAASGCIAADFNEDGLLDLAVANHKIYGDHKGYSEVWWNTAEGFLPSRTTKLPTCGPHGMYIVEPGNVLDRGPEEYYVSEPMTASEDLTVSSVAVEAEVPAKCWVKAALRVNGGAWREAEGLTVRKGDRLEYRLALGAKNALSTPRVTKVTVEFR